jgi:hypothetical protein
MVAAGPRRQRVFGERLRRWMRWGGAGVVCGSGGQGGGSPHVLLAEAVAAVHGSWLPPRSVAVVASGNMAARLKACAELICAIRWSSFHIRVREV